jgi:hypothetical protein
MVRKKDYGRRDKEEGLGIKKPEALLKGIYGRNRSKGQN